MIDRQYGRQVFECDGCGDTHETRKTDFNEAWAEAKAEGWQARPVSFVGMKDEQPVWIHSCPKCGMPA